MRKFGLIGNPLGHSFSKKYFTEKFATEFINETVYENFELPKIDLLRNVVAENPDLRGLNVTIPYKEAVIRYLDELSDDALEIGAVNTIKISSGKLKGFNTDYIGFTRSLIPLLKPSHKKALILGTGGSSLAVKYALEKLGIEYLIVSRNPFEENEIGYDAVNESLLNEHTLLINTTPVGMFPDVSNAPEIPYQFLGEQHLLFDLIYNPEETIFLKSGKEKGATTKNGSEMLALQAEEAWKIWNSF
ncbi:MAG: shikimate dehydrogenase [Chitinophagales bacterium]|nr:shikimate dehydrogenase [Chitinophagales bacterium]